MYFDVIYGSKVDFWCTPQIGEGTQEPTFDFLRNPIQPTSIFYGFWKMLNALGSILIDLDSIWVDFLIDLGVTFS